ncbi:hypothetical protein GJV04_17310 [Enterobacteriaceae bacterium RIT714]|nr:hypothetical protein [Enterobacteriaceae bacterium RIT714]
MVEKIHTSMGASMSTYELLRKTKIDGEYTVKGEQWIVHPSRDDQKEKDRLLPV